jgi:peptidoglycan/xylan/chitin deacetylase (PgdA/CDA1 family)
LRPFLDYLHAGTLETVPIDDFVLAAKEGKSCAGKVAITIDDGYADYGELAEPLFHAIGCPVCVFLPTGFIDGTCWLWWDRIAYALRHTPLRALTFRSQGIDWRYDLRNSAERCAAATQIVTRVEFMPEANRIAVMADLERHCALALPDAPPDDCKPLTWSEIRRLSERGTSFAPHTVTHPVLSTVDSERARWEIEESWRRLRAEHVRRTNVFCYPNGSASSFGSRDEELARESGFDGAVSTETQYATFWSSPVKPDLRFRLPRYGCPPSMPHLVQITTGVEGVKGRLRGTLESLRRNVG